METEISEEILINYGKDEINAFYRDMKRRNRSGNGDDTKRGVHKIIRKGHERREAAGLTPDQASLGIRLAAEAEGQRRIYSGKARVHHA